MKRVPQWTQYATLPNGVRGAYYKGNTMGISEEKYATDEYFKEAL